MRWFAHRYTGWRGKMVAGLMAGLAVPPATAQVTYSVFPAMSQSPSNVEQPTGSHGVPSITLSVSDSTIGFVIGELARRAHLRVIYDGNVGLEKRVSVRVTGMNIMDAFAVALRGTGLSARLASDGETVMIRPLPVAGNGHAQIAMGRISGRVTDSASRQGLAGAAVKVAGTKLTAVTSDSGNFTLRDVPAGDQVLTVRLFGYKPIDKMVSVVDSERTTVRIVMVPVPTVLSGVVTTAVGTQQRYQVGNDITVLNADSIQQVAPVSTVTSMLETRVPGLVVQHTNGIPGAPSRLRLRGLSSINMSADPILIIDGVRAYADQSGSVVSTDALLNGGAGVSTIGGGSQVGQQIGTGFSGPSALDQLDPNSIETIEVLKGPSATAIYGSDAANGVIVITTKHGRSGPTRWTLSLDEGRTTLPGDWPVNYFQFGHLGWNHADESQPNCGILEGCTLDSLVAFQALNDPRYSPLTGRPGQDHDASLTVSGGNGTLAYSVTGTASTQSGYLHLPPIELTRFQLFHGFPTPGWMRTPDQYTTYGGTSTLNIQLGQGGATVMLTSSLFRGAQQQSSLQNDLGDLSGMYVDTTQLTANPLFPDYYTRAQLKTTTFTNAISLNNWAPWHWLPLTATAGINVQNQDNNALLPRDYYICIDDPGSVIPCVPSDTLGIFSLSQATNTTGSLTVGTTLAQQHLVSTAVGINVYTLAQSSYAAATQGLPIGVSVPTQFIYNQGQGPSYNTLNSATYGWYLQPTINLNSRFFVSPGFRLDGGSNSGAQSGVNGGALSLFPKLDFSWVAVERPPSQPLFGGLTLLRPRIAFGIAGIQPGPAERLRLLQPVQGAPLTSGGPGTPIDLLQIASLGNMHLHPERDRELEGGIDAQFGNQRLTLTLTGYHKMAYDAILAVPVAQQVLPTGTSASIAENIGTIRNTGVEATAFARLLDNRNVDWSVNANVAHNQNLLVSLAPGVSPFEVQANTSEQDGYSTRIVPGYPLFGLWAKPVTGYADINHDGLIEPSEVVVGDSAVFIGAQQPSYELTLSTTLAFFNDRLTFNTSVDYQHGLTQTMQSAHDIFYNKDQQLYRPGLTPAEQAAISAGLTDQFTEEPQSGIGFLQTVNILRWNTFSVTYLVPPRLTHLVHVPSLSLALQGSNLGLHTSYRGADPSVNSFASGNLTQDTGGLLPPPRVWNLRVTIGD